MMPFDELKLRDAFENAATQTMRAFSWLEKERENHECAISNYSLLNAGFTCTSYDALLIKITTIIDVLSFKVHDLENCIAVWKELQKNLADHIECIKEYERSH